MRRPSPIHASDAEWAAWMNAQAAAAPGWAFDAGYCSDLVLSCGLDGFLLSWNLGAIICTATRPTWWPLPAAIPGPAEVLIQVEVPEAGERASVLIDRALFAWAYGAEGDIRRTGPDLVTLAAWRWGCPPARAAHRIARMAGRPSPMPIFTGGTA